MKRCSKCLKELDNVCFTKRKLSKDGLDLWCKDCKRINENKKQFLPTYEGDKTCMSCKLIKSRLDFHKDHRRKDGLESYCKSCTNIKSHKNHVKRKFNLTVEEYNSMLERQKHKCAICGNPESHSRVKRFAVDHSHVTGSIRGLLCSFCNTGLGQFQDSILLLENAIKYLTISSKIVGQE